MITGLVSSSKKRQQEKRRLFFNSIRYCRVAVEPQTALLEISIPSILV
ncbi:hypothetical protein [Dulcicalothrix desertica]|nr:hypothetical protein [Dulcicalothrix desertica]